MTAMKASKDDFLPHVHGMRTLAVLAVFAHHIERAWLPGGFVGVDIFFVISGFLITSHILRGIEKEEFALSGFYMRRVRRILPNQMLIIAVVLAFSFLLFEPQGFARVSASALYSSALASNFYFFESAGYFEPSAATMPLLHMWSLAVEEQFYLVWPLTLLILFVFSPTKRVWLLCLGFLIALAVTQLAIAWKPDAAFYMMPFRIIEFMCGALLPLLGIRLNVSASVANGMAASALAVIGATLLVFDEQTPFPGASALIPCAAASVIILSGSKTLAGRALGSRFMVALGERSFALYLTHWPAIVFYDRLFPLAQTVERTVIVVAIAFASAEVMYRFWERPLRYGLNRSHIQRTWYGLAMAASISALLFVSANGWARFGQGVADPDESDLVKISDCKNGEVERIADCDAEILVLGDSHSGHTRAVLSNFPALKAGGIARWAMPGCPPVFGAWKRYTTEWAASRTPICRALIEQWEKEIETAPAQIIVLAARWAWLTEPQDYGGETLRLDAMARSADDPITSEHSRKVISEQLSYTVDRLLQANKSVLLMGQVPLQTARTEACLQRYREEEPCQLVPHDTVIKRLNFMNQLLVREAERNPNRVIAYLPVRDLCDEESCRLLSPNGERIYRDTNHLNKAGAAYLSSQIGDVSAQLETWLEN